MSRTIVTRALLALLLASALLVLPVTGVPAVGERCAAAAGQVRVAVVVDTGAGQPAAVCVVVDEGATGNDVLWERARVLGLPKDRYPVWDGSGLLCSIDGFPEDGCGTRTPEGYRYWSYWGGDTGSWSYSSIGPGTRRVRSGSVEGWHFVDGVGNPNDPPPRTAPDSRSICGSEAPPTPAPPPAPPATTVPAPPATTAPPGPSPAPGGGGGGSGASGAPASTLPAEGSGAPDQPADPSAGGPTAADPSAPDLAAAVDDDAPGGGERDQGRSGGGGDGETAAAVPTVATSEEDGGTPVTTILGAVLVAAIGAGAVVRSRRLGSAG